MYLKNVVWINFLEKKKTYILLFVLLHREFFMLRTLFKMYIFLWNSSLASGFLYKTKRSHQPEKSGDNYAKHLKKSLVPLRKGMDGIMVLL